MAWSPRENSGVVFPNKYHEQGDNKPAYKGTVNVGGVEYDVAIWEKQGRRGLFLSLKFEEPEPPPPPASEDQAPPEPMVQGEAEPTEDGEIPF